jgi:hypothetical protein
MNAHFAAITQPLICDFLTPAFIDVSIGKQTGSAHAVKGRTTPENALNQQGHQCSQRGRF